jgi:hypothetical protein
MQIRKKGDEIKIFSSNGGHLGYRTALTDTILKGTHPGTIPARFGLIWFGGFRGEDLNVIFYQNLPNLHNRYKSTERSAVLYPRWPPLLKIEISSNGQNCSILSQNVPKFELYKHNDELFNIYYWIFNHPMTISSNFFCY